MWLATNGGIKQFRITFINYLYSWTSHVRDAYGVFLFIYVYN